METSGVTARIIPTDMISAAWPVAAPELQRALDKAGGENSLTDILALIVNERMQLWAIQSGPLLFAFGVTELKRYGQMSICRIVLWAGHSLEQHKYAVGDIEQFALEQGCSVVEWVGRPGFEKPMKEQGYKKQYVLMRKHLMTEPDGMIH